MPHARLSATHARAARPISVRPSVHTSVQLLGVTVESFWPKPSYGETSMSMAVVTLQLPLAFGEARHGTFTVAQLVKEWTKEISNASLRRRACRALLRRDDFLVHGYTPGCCGCDCIRYGTKVQGHSELCRERMEALLAQDPAGEARLEIVRRRLASYAEFKEGQRAKRRRTEDVGNSDPGAHWRPPWSTNRNASPASWRSEWAYSVSASRCRGGTGLPPALQVPGPWPRHW